MVWSKILVLVTLLTCCSGQFNDFDSLNLMASRNDDFCTKTCDCVETGHGYCQKNEMVKCVNTTCDPKLCQFACWGPDPEDSCDQSKDCSKCRFEDDRFCHKKKRGAICQRKYCEKKECKTLCTAEKKCEQDEECGNCTLSNSYQCKRTEVCLKKKCKKGICTTECGKAPLPDVKYPKKCKNKKCKCDDQFCRKILSAKCAKTACYEGQCYSICFPSPPLLPKNRCYTPLDCQCDNNLCLEQGLSQGCFSSCNNMTCSTQCRPNLTTPKSEVHSSSSVKLEASASTVKGSATKVLPTKATTISSKSTEPQRLPKSCVCERNTCPERGYSILLGCRNINGECNSSCRKPGDCPEKKCSCKQEDCNALGFKKCAGTYCQDDNCHIMCYNPDPNSETGHGGGVECVTPSRNEHSVILI